MIKAKFTAGLMLSCSLLSSSLFASNSIKENFEEVTLPITKLGNDTIKVGTTYQKDKNSASVTWDSSEVIANQALSLISDFHEKGDDEILNSLIHRFEKLKVTLGSTGLNNEKIKEIEGKVEDFKYSELLFRQNQAAVQIEIQKLMTRYFPHLEEEKKNFPEEASLERKMSYQLMNALINPSLALAWLYRPMSMGYEEFSKLYKDAEDLRTFVRNADNVENWRNKEQEELRKALEGVESLVQIQQPKDNPSLGENKVSSRYQHLRNSLKLQSDVLKNSSAEAYQEFLEKKEKLNAVNDLQKERLTKHELKYSRNTTLLPENRNDLTKEVTKVKAEILSKDSTLTLAQKSSKLKELFESELKTEDKKIIQFVANRYLEVQKAFLEAKFEPFLIDFFYEYYVNDRCLTADETGLLETANVDKLDSSLTEKLIEVYLHLDEVQKALNVLKKKKTVEQSSIDEYLLITLRNRAKGKDAEFFEKILYEKKRQEVTELEVQGKEAESLVSYVQNRLKSLRGEREQDEAKKFLQDMIDFWNLGQYPETTQKSVPLKPQELVKKPVNSQPSKNQPKAQTPKGSVSKEAVEEGSFPNEIKEQLDLVLASFDSDSTVYGEFVKDAFTSFPQVSSHELREFYVKFWNKYKNNQTFLECSIDLVDDYLKHRLSLSQRDLGVHILETMIAEGKESFTTLAGEEVNLKAKKTRLEKKTISIKEKPQEKKEIKVQPVTQKTPVAQTKVQSVQKTPAPQIKAQTVVQKIEEKKVQSVQKTPVSPKIIEEKKESKGPVQPTSSQTQEDGQFPDTKKFMNTEGIDKIINSFDTEKGSVKDLMLSLKVNYLTLIRNLENDSKMKSIAKTFREERRSSIQERKDQAKQLQDQYYTLLNNFEAHLQEVILKSLDPIFKNLSSDRQKALIKNVPSLISSNFRFVDLQKLLKNQTIQSWGKINPSAFNKLKEDYPNPLEFGAETKLTPEQEHEKGYKDTLKKIMNAITLDQAFNDWNETWDLLTLASSAHKALDKKYEMKYLKSVLKILPEAANNDKYMNMKIRLGFLRFRKEENSNYKEISTALHNKASRFTTELIGGRHHTLDELQKNVQTNYDSLIKEQLKSDSDLLNRLVPEPHSKKK